MLYIYDIKSVGQLLVRENEISLHKWSVGPAHLQTVEGTLPLKVATITLKIAAIEHWIVNSSPVNSSHSKIIWNECLSIREYDWAKYADVYWGSSHPLKPELPSTNKHFSNISHIRLNVFWSDRFAKTSSHSRIISNEQNYCSVTS